MRGGGGGAGPAFGPAPFLLGGVGAAKGLLPCFLVPTRNQPTACTLALWWLKFGPTDSAVGGGGGGVPGDCSGCSPRAWLCCVRPQASGGYFNVGLMSIHGPGRMGEGPNSRPRRFLQAVWGGGVRGVSFSGR